MTDSPPPQFQQGPPPKSGLGTGVKVALGCGLVMLLALLGGCAALVIGAYSVSDDVQRQLESATNPTGVQITLDEYNQIKEGMTLAEVEAIVGGPGQLISTEVVEGAEVRTYNWRGPGLIDNAVVIFTGDVVTTKTQIGLEPEGQ